jgi:glutathione synthase/RimK-type ligase-like ATP-grasp enzyme
MQYNFVIIRTDNGGRYARKILRSIKWLNENRFPQHEFCTGNYTISEFLNGDPQLELLNPENTIIHARCANPRTEWTIKLRELEERGYKVVNSVDTIELTSNKLACSLALQDRVNHPKSWEYYKRMSQQEKEALIFEISEELGYPDYIIAKPLTSLEQGANVKKVNLYIGERLAFNGEITEQFDSVPGNKIVIQEYIPYTALHRVIVIGGKALPYTFVDYANDPRKTDWKVSCCLNRTTMQLCENPKQEILDLAEQTQKEVGGVINFIDIFEYTESSPGGVFYRPNWTISEINTACSLNIHERLAKEAGRLDWNIHSRIARELVKELGV